MKFEFEQAAHPVYIEDGDAIRPALNSVFRRWGFRQSGGDDADENAIVATRTKRGYQVDAPWLDEPRRYTDDVNLACGLAVLVNRSMLEQGEGRLCLHGAGVAIGGCVVVFPNYYRAGKSTLTVCLAAAGARVVSDDILPILPDNSCMALGISPRLRLPLPEAAGPRTAAFVKAHAGAVNKQYLYVELEEDGQAPFGATAPFGGFVLLDRKDAGPARLEPVGMGEVLKQLVLRNFVRQMSADESLKRLHGIVTASHCFRLTYSNGDEAADLLMNRFNSEIVASGPSDAADTRIVEATGATGAHPWRRAGIGERFVDGDLFLVGETGESIFHLNPVGAGLWRLMDGNCSVQEAAMVLREAFPAVDPAGIERDVNNLVRDLQVRGLLEKPVDADPSVPA